MVIVPIDAMLAQEAAKPLLERLDELQRTAVVMALLGIVLAGMFLVACVVIGAHWVRRLARHGGGRTPTDGRRGNERLRRSLRGLLPDAGTDETVHIDAASDETRVDPPPGGS